MRQLSARTVPRDLLSLLSRISEKKPAPRLKTMAIRVRTMRSLISIRAILSGDCETGQYNVAERLTAGVPGINAC